ncbi:MAG: hypothetical protein ACRELF_16160 [Gemmataceae bacterium]
MLSQPSIEEQFKKFIVVRLYEDQVPEEVTQVPNANESQNFAGEKLGNWARPYYVVLTVKGKTLTKVAEYDKNTINSPAEFAVFLNQALAAAK